MIETNNRGIGGNKNKFQTNLFERVKEHSFK